MSKCFRLGRDKGLHARLVVFMELMEQRLPFDTVLVRGGTTNALQEALYAQGRKVPGPNATPKRPMGAVVTYAQTAFDTAHGRYAAADFAPIENGVIPWGDKLKFHQIGLLAEESGLVWGGRFTKDGKAFPDLGHVELPNWRELSMPGPLIATNTNEEGKNG